MLCAIPHPVFLREYGTNGAARCTVNKVRTDKKRRLRRTALFHDILSFLETNPAEALGHDHGESKGYGELPFEQIVFDLFDFAAHLFDLSP